MKMNFAVIGHPIGHTMSPFIHKKLFEMQGKNVEYSVFDISPECLNEQFSSTLKLLNGFNVTIPHKETIIPLIDEVDESALKYSAVNCVLCRDGKTYGCSTDAFGFTKALETAGVPYTKENWWDPEGDERRDDAFQFYFNMGADVDEEEAKKQAASAAPKFEFVLHFIKEFYKISDVPEFLLRLMK